MLADIGCSVILEKRTTRRSAVKIRQTMTEVQVHDRPENAAVMPVPLGWFRKRDPGLL